MDFLKKITVFTFVIAVLFQTSNAQDYAKIQKAFSDSYTQEYNGDYTNAIQLIKNVYDENGYEVNLRLGWLSYMAGFFTESTTYYQKCIDLKPMSIEAKFGFTYPASAMGNWEQVKKQYNDILKLDVQNSIANYKLGSIYYGNEDYTNALKYFEKVVNLYPFGYDGLIMFAWTNLKLGKFREAEVLFNKVLMYQPNDKSALEGLGEIK